MTRQNFLLDCDPGIDDAFAIFCAVRYGTVDLVTTVSGNVNIENTTRNALYLLELAGTEVPVHRGADRPLSVPPITADDIHGSSGLGNFATPEPRASEAATSATQAILDYCKDGGAVIVATGPLTNIARAIEADPSIVDRVDHLYWMGGATTQGNVTDDAEFNAWCDPHAAAVTLASGIPLTMFDLDLTRQVRMGQPEIDRLRAAGNEISDLFADALDFYRQEIDLGSPAHPMHDPCAVLGFLRPDHFSFRRSNIVCLATDTDERGRTLVNFLGEPLPHRVATTTNVGEVTELILMAILEQGDNR